MKLPFTAKLTASIRQTASFHLIFAGQELTIIEHAPESNKLYPYLATVKVGEFTDTIRLSEKEFKKVVGE